MFGLVDPSVRDHIHNSAHIPILLGCLLICSFKVC